MSEGNGSINESSLDWMYQESANSGVQSAEDYLLGKMYKSKDNNSEKGSDRFS